VVAAAIGLVAGFLVALFIWRIFFPDADSIGLGLIMAGFAAFCGLVSGVFAFPLCGEWLHERRKTLKVEQSPLPKTRVQRDNICLTGTYLVPLEPRTLLTNS
jgi:hypothetical protein